MPTRLVSALFAGLTAASAATTPRLLFVCNDTADLFLPANNSCVGCWPTDRFDSVSEALLSAKPADALLVGARFYPTTTTDISDAQWADIDALNLTVYLEYPARVFKAPPLPPPDTVGWQRVVVNDASAFAPWVGAAPNLRALGLLHVRHRPRVHGWHSPPGIRKRLRFS